MPMPPEGCSLAFSQHVSLGALLTHALALWTEHGELAQSDSLAEVLSQRELYARLSLKAMPASQQADLLDWASAHAVLAFITRDGMLERFASYSPASWSELASLSLIAERCGCADDCSMYALLTDTERLRRLVADAAPAASKLIRHLTTVPVNALAPLPRNGTRRRGDDGDDDDEQRVRVVRVRHAGSVWSRDLDWEEIAIVKEPSPGRQDLRLAGLVPMPSRF